MLDVTSGISLKLSTALLLFLILHSLNMQELGIPGIQCMGCNKFTDIIKAKGKGRNILELEMSSSHIPYKKIAVTVVPVHVIKAYNGSGGQLHKFLTSALNGGDQKTSCWAASSIRKEVRYPFNKLGGPHSWGIQF